MAYLRNSLQNDPYNFSWELSIPRLNPVAYKLRYICSGIEEPGDFYIGTYTLPPVFELKPTVLGIDTFGQYLHQTIQPMDTEYDPYLFRLLP